jgi:ABC-type nitrate/sulfonate/bicarbonate transport system permease component
MAVMQEAVTSPAPLGDIESAGWRRRISRGVLLPLGFAALATVGWEILCRMARISPLLLPPPSAVWAVLSENYAILFQ